MSPIHRAPLPPIRPLLALTSLIAALGCDEPTDPAVPGTIVALAGDGQSSMVQTTLATPLSVQVLDKDGHPLDGASVTWTVATGGGTLAVLPAAGDQAGRSQAFWTLGPIAGRQTVTAAMANLEPVTFSATALPPDQSLAALARSVRGQIGQRFTPARRAPPVRTALVRLGGALAFDKVLSGTNDISCMTCHHPSLGTGDARSLSIGQGASGLGALRTLPRGTSFIARNSPALFNLSGLNRLFHDGRVAVENGAFRTPAGAQLTPEMIRVLEFGALSALPMFPVTDRAEMRGATGNELAEIADTDFTGIWAGLMRRLGRVPEYRTMFEAAYPGTPFDQMTFAHASNAIAGYLIEAFTFTNSPLDQFLGGSDTSMSESQLRGAQAFVQQGCIACHTGPSLSDQQFHNTALAQIGPGKGNGESGRDDYGRLNVTQQNQDRYRFRTLPLRNIELTAPYGHAGEFIRLRDFVDHYSRSADKLRAYDVQQLEEPLRGTLLANFDQILANRDQRLGPTNFGPQTTDQITDFLRALTDPIAWSLEFLVPTRVPSGLPVDR